MVPWPVRVAATVGAGLRAERRGCRLGFGESEVEELRAGLRQHNVAGLQIAMRDPGPMCRCERIRNVDRTSNHLVQRQRPLR